MTSSDRSHGHPDLGWSLGGLGPNVVRGPGAVHGTALVWDGPVSVFDLVPFQSGCDPKLVRRWSKDGSKLIFALVHQWSRVGSSIVQHWSRGGRPLVYPATHLIRSNLGLASTVNAPAAARGHWEGWHHHHHRHQRLHPAMNQSDGSSGSGRRRPWHRHPPAPPLPPPAPPPPPGEGAQGGHEWSCGDPPRLCKLQHFSSTSGADRSHRVVSSRLRQLSDKPCQTESSRAEPRRANSRRIGFCRAVLDSGEAWGGPPREAREACGRAVTSCRPPLKVRVIADRTGPAMTGSYGTR